MSVQTQPKPATITVEVGDDSVHVHELADYKDWGISNGDTVLAVSAVDEDHYYPLDSVRKWSVKAHSWKKKITHFYPEEIDLGVKRKEKEGHRPLLVGEE